MDSTAMHGTGNGPRQRRQRPPTRNRNKPNNAHPAKSSTSNQEGDDASQFKEHDVLDHSGMPVEAAADGVIDFGQVSTDTKAYFKSVEARMDQQYWESDDELYSFLSNVYGEVVGKELSLATDPDCSIVLEKLLHISTDTHLRIFMDKLSGNYVHLFKHYCASHVMQTLITLSAFTLEREAKHGATNDGPEELPPMAQLFQRLCQQLESFWADIISDRHSSFVARALICVLAGFPVDAQLSTSKSSRQWAEKRNIPAPSRSVDRRGADVAPGHAAVPDICRQSLSTVVGELNQVLGERIRTYAFDPIVSPVAQQYLEVLTDKSDVLAMLLMRDDASLDISAEQRNSYIKSLMTHPVASRLLELALRHCPGSLYLDFFNQHGRGSLRDLCKHAVANFAVQSLISNAKTAAQLEIMIEELAPAFGDLLFGGRPLVVLKCLEAATALGIPRTALQRVYQAVAAAQPRDLFPSLLFLQRKYPDPASLAGSTDSNPVRGAKDQKRSDVNRAGNQIVSCILAMSASDNRELVDSFLARDMAWYHPLLLHPVASFTMQAFLASKTVNAPPKRKLLFSLLNRTSSTGFVDLAVNKFGSHIADAFWNASDLDARSRIALHLLEHEKKMTESHHGRFIWRNFNMASFKSKRQEWTARQKGVDQKRDMFREFFSEGDAKQKLGATSTTPSSFQRGKHATGGAKALGSTEASRAQQPDEIDVLFEKKARTGRKHDDDVEYVSGTGAGATKAISKDKSLDLVLDAIEATRKKKKRVKSEDAAVSDDGAHRKRQKRQFK